MSVYDMEMMSTYCAPFVRLEPQLREYLSTSKRQKKLASPVLDRLRQEAHTRQTVRFLAILQ